MVKDTASEVSEDGPWDPPSNNSDSDPSVVAEGEPLLQSWDLAVYQLALRCQLLI